MAARVTTALAVAVPLAVQPALAQQGGGGGRPPPAVTVVTLEAQDVQLTTRLPGRVVATEEAPVRPQVVGLVTERLFIEGAMVAQGDPLYRIDPDTYEAQVGQARAQVALAEAELRARESEAERLQQQITRNAANREALEQSLATRDSAAAQVTVARAALQAAEIDRRRTTIRAPISGVIGRALATRGALVTAGQMEPLAVIRSIDPVLVDITQSAAELVEWRRKIAKNPDDAIDQTVQLILADGRRYDAAGSLTAAEPVVDELTGVVTLRTRFPNPDRLLLPGMYVQVEVPQGLARGGVLAPMEGVTRNRRGQPQAMVVTEDNKVERRDLTVLAARDNTWIVSEGLDAGDRMIVAGLQKVSPGGDARPEERSAGEGDQGGGSPPAAEGEGG